MRTLGAKNKVPKPVKLSTCIQFRVTEREKEIIKRYSDKAGLSITDYARHRIFQDGLLLASMTN